MAWTTGTSIKLSNKIGDVINHWKLLSFSHYQGKSNTPYWNCICLTCNKTVKAIDLYSLRNGRSKQCASCSSTGHQRTRKNITGQKFGNWEVLKEAGIINGAVVWLCKCSCNGPNSQRIVSGAELRRDDGTRSCGCLSEHKSLVGNKFGALTVKSFAYSDYIKSKSGVYYYTYYYNCLCSVCGKNKIIDNRNIRQCHKSCGCIRNLLISEANTINRIGNKYGRLLVIKRSNHKDKANTASKVFWICKCDCGNKELVIATSGELEIGDIVSCGCYHAEQLKIRNQEISEITPEVRKRRKLTGETVEKARAEIRTLKELEAILGDDNG